MLKRSRRVSLLSAKLRIGHSIVISSAIAL